MALDFENYLAIFVPFSSPQPLPPSPTLTIIFPRPRSSPPPLAVTSGTRRAGGRQRQSLLCSWRAQQGRPRPWVLLTCSFNHAPRIPSAVANMFQRLTPYNNYPSSPLALRSQMPASQHRVAKNGAGPAMPGTANQNVLGHVQRKAFSSSRLRNSPKICLSSAGEAVRGAWR